MEAVFLALHLLSPTLIQTHFAPFGIYQFVSVVPIGPISIMQESA
jgi:hypothetical protein